MSCDIIRESQMIVLGGQIPNASLSECDVPKIGGQHGFLLGQESTEVGAWWHAIMDNTTGYRVPEKIVSLVGGKYVLRSKILHLLELTEPQCRWSCYRNSTS